MMLRAVVVVCALLLLAEPRLCPADDAPKVELKLVRSSDKGIDTEGSGTTVYALDIAPDGKHVLIGGDNISTTMVLWNLETGENDQYFDIFTQEDGGPIGVAISPDGKFAGATTNVGKVFYFDLATGNLLKKLEYPTLSPTIQFSPDSKRAAFADLQGNLTIVDCINAFSVIARFPAHNDVAMPVAWSHDGTRLITGARDNTARVWDSESHKELFKLEHPAWPWSATYSPDGKMIATGTGGGMEGNPLSQRYIVGTDNSIRLWDTEKGTLLRELKGHTDRVHALAFTRDGKRLVSGSFDKTMRVWDVATGKELANAGSNGWVTCVDITPDGRTIVAGGGSCKTGDEWKQFPGERLRVFRLEQ
jgi:WD40 repeat protein